MTSTPIVSSIGATVQGVNGSVAGLDRGLANLVSLGCTHAELSANALHITIAGRDNTGRVNEIAEVCARHELGYTLHAPIAINFMEEMHGDLHQMVMRSNISFAAKVGVSVIVIHPGRVHPQADRASRQRLLQVERDQVLRAADEAGRHGIRIGMENLNPNASMMAGTSWSYALDPRALAEQIDAIDHPAVCGTLDFAHGWLAASRLGIDYISAVREFAPFVGHLHVTDNCGMPITYVDATELEHVSYGMGDLHMPIGWGTVPYDELLNDLPIRPDTRATLEVKGFYGEDLSRSIAAARGIAERLNGRALAA
ncbi:MAG TPA: sugar phosphate isomerase/epimerase [Devosiaceae bacterium]